MKIFIVKDLPSDIEKVILQKDADLKEFVFYKKNNLNYFNLSYLKNKTLSEKYNVINDLVMDISSNVVLDFNLIADKDLNSTFAVLFNLVYSNYGKKYSKKTINKNKPKNFWFYKSNFTEENFVYFNFLKVCYEAQNLACNLADSVLNLEGDTDIFYKTIQKLCILNKNLSLRTYNEKQLLDYGMASLLAINKESRVLVIEYNGDTCSKEKIVIIGKGITSSDESINIYNIDDFILRLDKSGATNAFAVIDACSKLSLKLNIVCLIPIMQKIDNINSIQSGDIVIAHNKKTIQIEDNNLKGRIVLADLISFACTEYKPREIITIATLGSSMKTVLGKHITGCFTNNIKRAKIYEKYFNLVGEDLWILPIHWSTKNSIKNSVLADYTSSPKDIDSNNPSIIAAFLNEFVPKNVIFIHLDISGTHSIENRATGSSVRGLINTFYNDSLNNNPNFD